MSQKSTNRQANLCTYQRLSRGGDPRDIREHGAGFVEFCWEFLARDGGIALILHFFSRIPGESGGFSEEILF